MSRQSGRLAPRRPKARHSRHPRCGACGYNLTGLGESAIGARIRCPECGESFLPHEIDHGRRPERWTLMHGIIGLARSLTWRTALAFTLLLAVIYGLDAVAASLFAQGSGGQMRLRTILVIAFVIGPGFAMIMYRGLSDAAGFESWLNAFSAIGAFLLAMLIVRQIGYSSSITSYDIDALLFCISAIVLLTIGYQTVVDLS